ERDAEAAADGARHRLLQAELEPYAEVALLDAGAAQLVLDHLTDACAFLHQDQLLALQLLERDGLAGEAMAGRAGEDHRVAEERLVLDGAVTRRRADDAEPFFRDTV